MIFFPIVNNWSCQNGSCLFGKPDVHYDDSQTDIKIESENDVLDLYHHCWQVSDGDY